MSPTHWRRQLSAISILVLGLVAPLATVSAQASPPSAPRISAPISVGASGAGSGWVDAVSCVDHANCLAVGLTSNNVATAATSADSGQSWSGVREVVPTLLNRLLAVTCNSATSCVAVGDGFDGQGAAVVATLTKGVWKWSAPAEISSATTPSLTQILMTAVSCVSATNCLAVGIDETNGGPVMSYSTNGGHSWTHAVAIGLDSASVGAKTHGALEGLDCPTSDTCIAVGRDALSSGMASVATWSNNAWSFAATSTQVTGDGSNVGSLTSISCPTSLRCVAVGQDSSSKGVTSVGVFSLGTWFWSAEQAVTPDANGLGHLNSVRCEAGTNCVAVGQDSSGVVATASTNAGASWSTEIPISTTSGLHPILAGVTCVSATSCLAVGSAGVNFNNGQMIATTTSDLGTTWAPTSAIGGSGIPSNAMLDSISCSNATHCVSLGSEYRTRSYAAVSNNAGATWSREKLIANAPGDSASLGAISCPSASLCVSVGSDSNSVGVVSRSTNGGRSWSTISLVTGDVNGSGALTGVSCMSATRCVAVGSDPKGNRLTTITNNAGITWSAESMLPTSQFSQGGFISVSCPSATRCVASSFDLAQNPQLLFTTNGGATWRNSSLSLAKTILYSVSCASITHCVATGVNGADEPVAVVTTNGGVSWGHEHVFNASSSNGGAFQAVACSHPSICVAMGTNGYEQGIYAYSTTQGLTWSSVFPFDPHATTPNYFLAGDCVNAVKCVIVGSGRGYVGLASSFRFAATVTFSSRGARGTMNPQSQFSAAKLHANHFVRAGYEFLGWATSVNGKVRYANSSRFAFDQNTTLFAVWKKAA